MPRNPLPAWLAALAVAVTAAPAFAQTYTWIGADGGAWLTPANWTGGSAGKYPGTSAAAGSGTATDIALFNNATANVGIDMGAAGGTLTLGAINFQSGTALTIGNSSAGTPGALQLNGATVNGVSGTLIAVGNTGADLTVANTAAGGASTMSLQLGTANGVFNVYGDATTTRNLTINTNVTEAAAGSGFTVRGGGNVTLGGTTANTFTGTVTVANGRLTVTNTTGLRGTAGTTVVQNGGTLYLNAAMTTNETISIAGNGFTEPSLPVAALRLGNFAITLGGNATLTGDSRVLVEGNTTTVNGVVQESGGARALEISGGGTLALTAANTYTGATNVTLGTLNLTGANGALASPAVNVSNGATFTLTNAAGANNANRIPDAAPVTLNNGTFNFSHNNTDAVNFAETVGPLNASTYLNTVSASQAAAGQTSTLTFASLNRAASGGVNFTGTGLGGDATNQVRFTTAPSLDAGGMIGAWALYGGTDFATYGANGVAAATANTDTTGATWTTASNLKFTTGTITIPGSGQVNSVNLAQTAAVTVDLAGNTGRLGSGGILATGAFNSTIANGSVTAGTATNAPGELIVSVLSPAANPLTISANIIDNGSGAVSLTKLGGGNLVLSGANTFSGPVTVTQGALVVASDTALGSSTSVTVKEVPSGGTGTLFQLSGGRTISGVTLNLESLIVGGIPGSATGPVGTNSRTAFQAVGGGTSIWNGPILVTGNSFTQIYLQPNSSLVINGPISAGAAGFTGFLFLRGGGTGTMTFNGPINLPNGALAITDTTNIVINSPSSGSNNWATTDVFTGVLQLGGNNVLPPAAVMSLGQNGSGNLGTVSLSGFNATVAGLNISPGSTGAAASQIVQNGNATAGQNSTLTFAGNATPSTFAGTLRDGATAGGGTLALAVTAGRLTLTGTANTYSGGTTVNGGGTLLVNNASGSATGTGPVTVLGGGGPLVGGTLGGTGTISGAVSVMTIQGPGIIAPGIGGIGTLTLGSGLTLNGEYIADVTTTPANASDLIAITGNLSLTGSALTLPASNTYAPFPANVTYTLLTFTGTRTGVFATVSGLPANYQIVYAADAVQLVPVPEPAGLLGLAAAAFALAAWRHRWGWLTAPAR
jgi:autotransporter-associated beta strand protein